jgi:hypothetical protein
MPSKRRKPDLTAELIEVLRLTFMNDARSLNQLASAQSVASGSVVDWWGADALCIIWGDFPERWLAFVEKVPPRKLRTMKPEDVWKLVLRGMHAQ